jgi:glycosyltransferase involved in cell wall biosynthesis
MTTEGPAIHEGIFPLLSVVIPTRNRAKTLRYCLETIIGQSYPSIQIIVSDNNSSDNTRDLVASFDDSRITYVRSDQSLSMNDSYNFALNAVRGEYVTFIGDDDGFLPDAIAFGMNFLSDKKYSAITWRKMDYHWPDHRIAGMSNVMHGQSEPLLLAVNGTRKLKLLSAFREGYNNLPCIYNSIVEMRLIEKVKECSPDGLFFGGIIPDVHSGIALSPFVGAYLQAWFPLSVNGASSMSGGVLQGMTTRTPEEEGLIKDISPAALKRGYHPDIGLSTSVVSIAYGEYLLARSRLQSVKWPKPRWRRYVKALIREAVRSTNQEAILASARHTVKRRKMLIYIPKPRYTSSPSGSDNNYFVGRIILPTELVANVSQASKLLASLLPDKPHVEGRPKLYFLRKWFRLSFRIAIDVYRTIRSRCG